MCGHIWKPLGKMTDKAPISSQHRAVLAFERVDWDPVAVKLSHE